MIGRLCAELNKVTFGQSLRLATGTTILPARGKAKLLWVCRGNPRRSRSQQDDPAAPVSGLGKPLRLRRFSQRVDLPDSWSEFLTPGAARRSAAASRGNRAPRWQPAHRGLLQRREPACPATVTRIPFGRSTCHVRSINSPPTVSMTTSTSRHDCFKRARRYSQLPARLRESERNRDCPRRSCR